MLKTLGTMGVIASVIEHLQGIDFPKSKEDIVQYAVDSDVPDDVIEILERIPVQTYNNMGDLIYRMRGF